MDGALSPWYREGKRAFVTFIAPPLSRPAFGWWGSIWGVIRGYSREELHSLDIHTSLHIHPRIAISNIYVDYVCELGDI